MKNICKEKLLNVMKTLFIKCVECNLFIIANHLQQYQFRFHTSLKWCNSMYYLNSNILKYSPSEHHAGLISIVPEPSEIFLILFPIQSISSPLYYYWILMYVDQFTRHTIARMIYIRHLHLFGFIDTNVLNIGFLMYP